MRTPNVTPIERAFQLARSGQCRTTADIQLRMKAEGYPIDQVIGPTLRRQLRAAMDRKYCPPLVRRKAVGSR
jgi:hypothetical protein